MNIIISIVLMFMGLLALKYNALLLFGATALAATVASPRAWIYTVGSAVLIFLLYLSRFPSWDVVSLVVIAVAYGLMSKVEEKKDQIPPELLAYMMAGGYGGYR